MKGSRARGSSGADVIVVMNRRGARVNGRGGDDRICGGRGRDRLVGGPGSDQLTGSGRDVLVGDRGVDSFRTRGRRVRTDATAGESINGRLKQLDAKLRRGAVAPGSRYILSVAELSGGRKRIILRRGASLPKLRGVLVVNAGGKGGQGVVGRVLSKRSLSRRRTQLVVKSVPLSEAFSRFRASLSGSFAGLARAQRRGSARISAAPLIARVLARVSCSGGVSVRPFEVDLGSFSYDLDLDANVLSPYLSIFVLGSPTMDLGLNGSANGSCTGTLRRIRKNVGPVVVEFEPKVVISASGRVNLGYRWNPFFSYHLVRGRGQDRDDRRFDSRGAPNVSGQGRAEAKLALDLSAEVGGQQGLYGSISPRVTADASVRLSPAPARACARANAAVDYDLVARASVFLKRWSWGIANGSFLNRTLLDRCTTSGGGGGGVAIGPYRQVAAGSHQSCVLRNDYTVTCRGDDTRAASGRFVQISTGSYHGCGLRESGEIACWGDNSVGESSPPTGPFTQVTVGQAYSCGLRPDGTAVCWGGYEGAPAPTPTGYFSKIDAGFSSMCGIGTDGTITMTCWGAPPSGKFKDIAAGWRHTCAIKDDDTLTCWGTGSNGQTDPPSGKFSQVASEHDHSCAVSLEGQLACWGENDYGKASPPTGTFKQVSVSTNMSCGVRTNGSAVCWGIRGALW